MRPVRIGNRWEVVLPDHKADLPCWPHWEHERLTASFAAIRPTDRVLDVGAEQGDLSALFASWLDPDLGGEIALVEPASEAWPTIRATFEANGLPAPAWCSPAFFCDARRERKPGPWISAGWPPQAEGELAAEPGFRFLEERPEIPAATLDSFVAGTGFRPDVVTIDVEGAELLVLEGARETLTERRPTVLVSVHPEMMRESFGQTPDDLHVLMTRHLGYREGVYLGFDHEQHWLFQPTVSR